jgi:formylglycine-generating enzyme required for sulfatase activity
VEIGSPDDLFDGFEAPGREYTIKPFWIWNSPVTAEEASRQTDAMIG